MRWIFCFIFVSSCLYGELCCPQVRPRNRSDEIPVEHVAWQDDEYLTGYIQSLIDMNYFEFRVRVIVQDHVAYVYNLPRNEVTAQSILCFVRGVPCVQDVRRMTCCTADAGSCCMPTPYCQTRGIWFPYTTVLFAPLIADPRQVTNSGALRFNDDVIGKRVGAVTFGDDFGIYRWIDVWRWHGDLEFLVQAGIFSVFDLSDPKYCLVNTDFFVAPMLEYAFDWWSFRYRLWHMSSHLGDEFLVENPGFDRRNLSDEGTE